MYKNPNNYSRMDRKKEESEELIKSESSMPSTTPSRTTANTAIMTTPADDDISTDSCETFESWTLVNDKEKKKLRQNLMDNNENRVEDLNKNDADDEKEEKEERNKTEQEPQSEVSPNDVNYDDMSDGISIISESESVGRITPHPEIRDHLHDLHIKFSLSDHMDDTILNKMREDMENETVPLLMHPPSETTNEQHLRQRRRSSKAAETLENQAVQEAFKIEAGNTGIVPFVKRGLQGIFYVGVGLALLGLIGKIVNPNWQPLANVVNSSPSADELEQKLTDMELQNNLMRAEIDLLNKQVKYLSSLNEPPPQQQRKPAKYPDYKESKTFKAWSGNGDSLRPVDITKQDLKKPYKCPDGSFVEIAHMCMEQQSAHEPSIVDQFGHVVENMKEKSEVFKTFEQVAEELQGFQDNPFEQLQDVFKEQVNTDSKTKEFAKNKPIYDDQKYQPKSGESNLFASHKHHKKFYGKNDNTKPSKEYNKYSNQENWVDNSQERQGLKRNFNCLRRNSKKDSEENSEENHSKEHYNKQKRKHDDSGEWQEKYMRHREQQRKNNGNSDDSGEWQEKYMKYREQLRKQNDQKDQNNNKNWYIKRGDSRENKRSGEKQYR